METETRNIPETNDELQAKVKELKDRVQHGEFSTNGELNVILNEIKEKLEFLGENTTKETISLLMSFLTHPNNINMGLENFSEVYTLVDAIEKKQGRLVPRYDTNKLHEA